jgi:Photosynthesis system II assembly factor YCF48
MENVPKIVTERLKSTAIAADHPDADVLAAFSERALADRERSRVVEHLAHCMECREVVALALPMEEPGLAIVPPIRSGWLTWPKLRWGLVAAGVIVVGSFGVLRYERTMDLRAARADGVAPEAKNQLTLPPAPSEDAREQKSSNSLAATSPDVATKPKVAEAKKKSDAVNLVPNSQSPRDEKAAIGSRMAVLHGQALPHGPMPPAQWQQNLNANAANHQMMFQAQAPAPAPAVPASSGDATAVTVSTQSSLAAAPAVGGPVSSEKQSQNIDALPINGRNVAALTPLARSNAGEVARAKDAEPPAANAPKTAGAYDISETPTSNFSPTGSLVPESARWAINSAGGLQRSFDQGKTWQSVGVNGGERDSSGVNLQLAMKSSHAKTTTKDKADAKAKPIIFRAVAANGPDVWAGASEANLFHSTDSGDHWMRIQPSWRGIELTGDILSLQFADPQHGRIVTSTAEIWTTADAGQTWDKQ